MKLYKLCETTEFGIPWLKFDVYKLKEWARATLKPQNIPIRYLEHELGAYSGQSDEPVFSQEFDNNSILSSDDPVLVIKDRDNKLHLADGRHRLWKVVKNNKKSGWVSGRIIGIDDIPSDILDG